MGAEDKFTEAAKELGKGYLSNQYGSSVQREAFLRDQHQKVLRGNSSVMQTNSAKNDPDSDRDGKKKSENTQKYLRLIQQMDQIFNDMSDILHQMQDNDRKIKLGIKALKDRNETEARLLLMDEFGMTPEEVEKLSSKEAFEKLAEKVEGTIRSQQDLEQRIKELAEDYKTKANEITDDPKLKQFYLDRLDALEKQAKQYNSVDYDKAFEDVYSKEKYELLSAKATNSGDTKQENQEKVSKASTESEWDNLNETDGEINKESASIVAKPPTAGMG